MFRRTTPPPARSPRQRRGAILIVVLALLALFAVIAISFVFYADAEATGARIYRETQSAASNTAPPAPDPSGTMDSFLSAFLFDVGDTITADLTNSLRGHSLMATMYSRVAGSTGMFNGPGTIHESPGGGAAFTIDRGQFINYTAFRTWASGGVGYQDVLMDPEWSGGIRTGGPTAAAPTLTTPLGRTFIPKNAGYTYPDLNNFYLAMLSPVTGEVLVPSYTRPWLFNPNNTNTSYRLAPWNPSDTSSPPGTYTANNTDWVSPDGRAKMLRPRPVDQLQPSEITAAGVPYPIPPYSQLSAAQKTNLYNLITNAIASGSIIPYPSANADGSYTGDYQNLSGTSGVQKNDSILIDIGLAPQQWNGQWIKPMISVLIADLDGRMNLNAAGNTRNQNSHDSYAGYGPWEQNLGYVLNSQGDANSIVSGRTGNQGPFSYQFTPATGGFPAPAPSAVPINSLPFRREWNQGLGSYVTPRLGQYAQVDWDGTGPNGAAPIQLPAFPSTQLQVAPAYFPVPWISGAFYQSGQRVTNSGNVYQCTATGGPSASGPTGTTTFTDGMTGLHWSFVGPAFWAPGPFAVGQQTINGINVYQCTKAGTSAAPGPTGTGSITESSGVMWNYIGSMVFDDNTNPQKAANHPALYNANYWGAPTLGIPLPSGGPIAFPPSDLKRLSFKYADTWSNYSQTSLAQLSTWPTSLLGPTTAPAASALTGYYQSSATSKRMLVTTLSAGFDRPSVMANFNQILPGSTPSTILSLPTAPAGTTILHAVQTTSFPGAFPNPPTTPVIGTSTGPAPGTPNLTDFTSSTDTRNLVSATLGPVDLNRPLADYRNLSAAPNVTTMGMTTTLNPQPISIGNMGNFQQAMTDRQNLAMDIFVRLAVASGAAISVNQSTGVVTLPQTNGMGGFTLTVSGQSLTVTAQEYNALRYLAQIAANMVDYIDLDDVSTAFVWNPLNPADPYNFNQTAGMDNFVNQQSIANRVVFGVEKTRLVVNEAYAEVTNDPTDTGLTTMGSTAVATKPPQVRFWLELLNPTASPYPSTAAASSSLLNDGSVPLWSSPSSGKPFSPYKVVISHDSSGAAGTGAVTTNLKDPTNVTGDVSLSTSTVTPDVVFDFGSSAASPVIGISTLTNNSIPPNGGTYSSGVPNVIAPGVVVVQPQAFSGATIEWSPTTGVFGATSNLLTSGPIASSGTSNAMGYTLGSAAIKATDLEQFTGQAAGVTRHVVLLRRLANPYLPPNDPTDTNPNYPYNTANPPNPYITVDMMDFVPAMDAVRVDGQPSSMGGEGQRMVKTTAGGTGYDPPGTSSPPSSPAQRASVGKVQPYAGFASATAGTNTQCSLQIYPNSFVIPQTTVQSPASTPPGPLNTFGRHNGVKDPLSVPTTGTTVIQPTMTNPNVSLSVSGTAETLMAPFDWVVHLDRPVVNTMELFNLTSVKPHEFTKFFLQTSQTPTSGDGARRDMPLVPWLGMTLASNQPGFDTTNKRTFNGLYRALDMIRVKPWGYGVPSGGRQYGRVNLNTVQDVSVVQGVLDPQAGNVFNGTDVNNLWTTYFTTGTGARTVSTVTKTDSTGTQHTVPVPGPTVDDIGSGTLPTGVSALDRPFRASGVGEYTAGGMAAQFGTGLQDTMLRVNPSTGVPLAWVSSQSKPYFQTEMLRKMANNATTVSNTFTVHATIAYYQVRTDANGNPLNDGAAKPRYLLGQEVYRQVPGDMRQQYFAVVDRSNVALTTAGGAGAFQPTPFYTSLEKPPVPVTNAMNQVVAHNLYLPSVTNVNVISQYLQVTSDGQTITIIPGTTSLIVGSGPNQETRTVSSINNDGSVSVGKLNNTHNVGECISNAIPGHPGIPGETAGVPVFDVLTNTNSPYRRVVPYIVRTR